MIYNINYFNPDEDPEQMGGEIEASTATAFPNRKSFDKDYKTEMPEFIRANDIQKHDPKLKKQYLKSRKKDFKFWEGFYKQFKGTEYNQIWENFLQNREFDNLSQLITPDSEVLKNVENIPENFWDLHTQYSIDKMPDYYSKAYKKQNKYIDLYPREADLYNNWEKQTKKFLKYNVDRPLRFISRINNTPKALIGKWLANRYAKSQGAPSNILKYSPIEKVIVEDAPNTGARYNDQNGNIYLGVRNGELDYRMRKILAHEAAHTRNLYNTHEIKEFDKDGNLINPKSDSPYYNNNYDYINPKYKELLAPTVEIESDHDSELSEHYADLYALRMSLRDNKINRGFRLYTNRDLKRFLNTYDGQQDRYLQYHTDIKNVRKALNRIWRNGGKLNKKFKSDSSIGTYTPCILDNKVWEFDDEIGLTSYTIPTIMDALKKDISKSDATPEEINVSDDRQKQLTVIIPEESPKSEIAKAVSNTTFGKHVFKHSGMNVGYMNEFLNEAAKYGIFFRVTSGVRPGAKTKQGRTSYHSLGHAIDVTPIQGETYEDLKYKIKNSPGFVKWMQDNGYGIFDETTPEVMKRTGASGAHWHIGRDRVAIKGLQTLIS